MPLLLFSLGARPAKWKDPTDPEKQIVENAEKGFVGAVYLERLYEVTTDWMRVHVRVKILSQAGFDAGTVEGLDEDASEIQGRTISPSGRVTELASSDIRTITAVKIAGVTLKTKAFTLPALEPGCFIEYSYREPGPYGAGWLFKEIPFQEKYPILFQELRTPESFPYYTTLRNQKPVQIGASRDKRTYVFSAKDAPAVSPEPYGLPRYERAALLAFSWPITSIPASTADEYWREAAGVIATFLKDKLARPEKMKERLNAIEGLRDATPPERLGAIYRYVRATVRNRSVLAAGETEPKKGWKENASTRDVLSRGLGTPLDLVAVFGSLLRSDGWRFRVICVTDREERLFHTEIPSFFQFGGVIVEINDRKLSAPIYASFDHPLLSLGIVPWKYLGADAFAVDPILGVGENVSVAHPPSDENGSRRDWNIQLSGDGDARIERTSRLSGQPAFEIREAVYEQGRDAFEKARRAHFEQLDSPGEVESFVLENERIPEVELVERIQLTRKAIVNALPGDRIEFSPLNLIGQKNPFTRATRTEPVIFPYPFREADTLTIKPPEGYRLEGLPRPTELRTDVGRYLVEVKKGEHESVTVARTFELAQFFGPRLLYPAYKHLFESAARNDAGLSVVWKKATTPATPSGR